MISLQENKEVNTKVISATFYSKQHTFIDYFANVRYLIKLLIQSKVFHNKLGNGLDFKEFKDVYTFRKTIIAGSIAIKYYKKCTWGNWNSAITGMDTINIDNNELNQIDTLESNAHFLDFEDDNNDI